jgi:hypothetical protein
MTIPTLATSIPQIDNSKGAFYVKTDDKTGTIHVNQRGYVDPKAIGVMNAYGIPHSREAMKNHGSGHGGHP